MISPLLTSEIRQEQDTVAVRQRARQVAALLGVTGQGLTRIATAVSEIARNTFGYAGGGRVEFALDQGVRPCRFLVRFSDQGPGIGDLAAILEGRYRSSTGMGLGIVGARRLVDHFHIESAPGQGTKVELGIDLASDAKIELARLSRELASFVAESPLAELQRQNKELVRTLAELREREEHLAKRTAELEETNRAVMTLYAELDEKANALRRADELKSRFLSNMSHEFRTPASSIIGLTGLILSRVDGELTAEQEKQVGFIRQSAQTLLDLINDLLDLAKIEAGKSAARPSEFRVCDLFAGLRGMFRPLANNPEVELIIEAPAEPVVLVTDEGKLGQILRNLIANALKFTEKGEVRVTATLRPDQQAVVFTVRDTGIGIAPEHHERIFEEFGQVDSAVQRKVKGTGLGLHLSRQLAALLGGTLTVASELGKGATFTLTVPAHLTVAKAKPAATKVESLKTRKPVLIIEDNQQTLLLYEKYLRTTGFEVVGAASLQRARQILETSRPVAIILDILLPGEDGWGFLAELKQNAKTRDLPVLVASILDQADKGLALGADDYCVKPVERAWLIRKLESLKQGNRRHHLPDHR